MKGDIYMDFAIATFLFILAFSLVFYYYNYELNSKIENEKIENANLKIQNIIGSLPMEEIEKRIIVVEGNSNNEFVNLSGYDIDLILDENNNRICFDQDLKGFIVNISGRKEFYLYSLDKNINKYTCNIVNFNNTLAEEISSPIYESYLLEIPNYSGKICEQRIILVFSEYGPEEKNLRICT
jgi:hypothetical protein